MFIKRIKRSSYYKKYHEEEVGFEEVLGAIFSVKNPKRKGKNYVYKTKGCYITIKKKRGIFGLWDAKRTE